MTEPEEDFSADEEFEAEDEVDPAERDLEAPPEDAAEQATPADPADVPLAEQMEVHRGLEVDEADAIEQSQVVNLEDEG